jgi:transcriptional accessory protein Tex/SPT6
MSDQETATPQETVTTEAEAEAGLDVAVSEPVSAPAQAEVEESLAPDAEADFESEADPDEGAGSEDGDSILNLRAGRKFDGVVKNITAFGAFVNIGLAQDGLVHISELARHKVESVTDVVSEGQAVEVWVKRVDKKRGRISLTMVKPIALKFKDINEDDELEGVVTRLESYGAFVDINSDREGLVHISQITHDYINHPEEALKIGDPVKVKVLKVNRKKRQVDLSIKALLPPPVVEASQGKAAPEPVEYVAEVAPDEPAPTAMALAYAAFQGDNEFFDRSHSKRGGKANRSRRREMDSIVARTLAARD